LALAVAVVAPLGALPAAAQTPGPTGGQLGPPPGATIGEEEPRKQGVAEKAPKEQAQLPTLPPLPPYPGQDKKKFELVEFDGYFRMRADWMDNFNLGFNDDGDGIPFQQSLSCRRDTENQQAGYMPVNADGCKGSIASTNMRFRVEPTINLSESVAIHLQVDALDNLVLGSTPRGIYFDSSGPSQNVPSGGTSPGQTTPSDDEGSPWDSIRVKQAWADVKTPLGALRFGRMPNHFGLGIFTNGGGYDPVHDTTCVDCDYGDNVDRFIFGTTIPGTRIRGAVGYDWQSTFPSQSALGNLTDYVNRQDGQPLDPDDADDANQYVLMFSRIDDPETWRQTLREGGTAFNWAIQFFYRTQDYDIRRQDDPDVENPLEFVSRKMTAYVPDVWARFTTGRMTLEAELAGVFGSLDNIVDPAGDDMTLAQFGGVLRLTFSLLDDDLELGVELGFASGDEWENEEQPGAMHIDNVNYLPQRASDTSISHFQFSRDYHIDLILFRELKGAVSNALYARPWVRYDITDRFGFRAQAVASFAHKPIATPGNESFYGVELDGDLGYSNEKEGFFAGLSYGVLFPLAALDRPFDIFPNNEGSIGASTAQTFQLRFILKY
jgi:uncharacterized protein (TIGR04551 family)